MPIEHAMPFVDSLARAHGEEGAARLEDGERVLVEAALALDQHIQFTESRTLSHGRSSHCFSNFFTRARGVPTR